MPRLMYHFPPSGPSRAALLTARVLGVQLELKVLDLFARQHLNDTNFIKINPQHTFPTLVEEDGFVVWDSHAIAIYLAETHDKSGTFYPRDPKMRARVNQLLNFDIGTLYARIRAITFPALFQGVKEISDEKIIQVNEAFLWLELFLKDSPWVAGTNMTIADCSCVASVISFKEVGYDVSKYKAVSDWIAKCRTAMAGFDENEAGAKLFGQAVRSKLTPGQLG